MLRPQTKMGATMNYHDTAALRTGRATALGLALGILAFAPQAVLAAGKAPSIEGVWRVTKVTATGANPMTIESPQPSLYIFARGHYSNVTDTSRTPRTGAPAFKDPAHPSDAEKLAKYDEWAPIAAQAGSYEVKGSTLVRHPIVAKNVGALAPGGTTDVEIKVTGNTLVMIAKSPAGAPAREQRVTLTRVK